METFVPYTAAATWLKRTDALEKKFTFVDRFEEEVKVYRISEDGDHIGVPRGAVSVQQDVRELGFEVLFQSAFKPQRPDQLQVIAQAVDLLKQDQQFILQAPTGWGKSWAASEIAGRMGRRFCVIVTKEDILYQWKTAIQQTLLLQDEEIGVWRGDQVPTKQHKAVIALIQSVMKGLDRYESSLYRDFGLILCDEIHHLAADQFSQAMWCFPAKHRMGLSATPYRRDGRDRVFHWHIGPVKVSATIETMIPKVLIHETGWKVPRFQVGKGQWKQIPHDFGNTTVLLKPMCRNTQRNELIIRYLLSALEKERNVLALSDTIEHLKYLTQGLLAAGVKKDQIGYYVGLPSDLYDVPEDTPKRKMIEKEKREQHKNRPIILATVAMAGEATDIPWLDMCVLCTPRANVQQIVGRIRREYENKKEPVVVDLLDSDSPVLAQYGKSRLKWYRELGCKVVSYV